MEPWEGVVRIPEGESGSHRVRHFKRQAGPIERSNLRTAFIGGQWAPPLEFDHETTWHELRYEGGVWMTDLPIEQEQHDKLLEPVDGGRVLIGGLGVGYAATVLAAREDVYEVVIVEISEDVIKLVAPHLRDPEGKITVVHADLFDYLRGLDEEDEDYERFDWAFYDIWQADSEDVFFNVVCKLRELSWEHVDDDRIICWNENVMRGQLYTALQGRAFQTFMQHPGLATLTVENMAERREGEVFWNWCVPFWEAVRDGAFSIGTSDGDEINMSEEFARRAGEYAGTYGHFGWRVWWDAVRRGLT